MIVEEAMMLLKLGGGFKWREPAVSGSVGERTGLKWCCSAMFASSIQTDALLSDHKGDAALMKIRVLIWSDVEYDIQCWLCPLCVFPIGYVGALVRIANIIWCKEYYHQGKIIFNIRDLSRTLMLNLWRYSSQVI